jgi:hypothetical protein
MLSSPEKDMQRILTEQALVTKRAKEFESRLDPLSIAECPVSAPPATSKVGFAAIQERARKQELELLGITEEAEAVPEPQAFLRLDMQSKCLTLEGESTPAVAMGPAGMARFPLDVATPAQSPPASEAFRNRIGSGSARYLN